MDSEITIRFKILKEIGKGAFSIVYKAFDIINKRECALKIYYKDKIKKSLLSE